ncbi:hypothetical protein MferCBS49748_004992 [Microsporum ferrugineum]
MLLRFNNVLLSTALFAHLSSSLPLISHLPRAVPYSVIQVDGGPETPTTDVHATVTVDKPGPTLPPVTHTATITKTIQPSVSTTTTTTLALANNIETHNNELAGIKHVDVYAKNIHFKRIKFKHTNLNAYHLITSGHYNNLGLYEQSNNYNPHHIYKAYIHPNPVSYCAYNDTSASVLSYVSSNRLSHQPNTVYIYDVLHAIAHPPCWPVNFQLLLERLRGQFRSLVPAMIVQWY